MLNRSANEMVLFCACTLYQYCRAADVPFEHIKCLRKQFERETIDFGFIFFSFSFFIINGISVEDQPLLLIVGI